jgi:hypothetical protein
MFFDRLSKNALISNFIEIRPVGAEWIVGKTRSDKCRNNRIRKTLDQETILNYIERRSTKWYGHVVRMQDYRKPKQAM